MILWLGVAYRKPYHGQSHLPQHGSRVRVSVIEFLGRESGNVFWTNDRLGERAKSAIKQACDDPAGLDRAYDS